tara:strand:+ start:91024 stop:91242 length:219 start_codon:yes stop_codon:yes gene_type:complete
MAEMDPKDKRQFKRCVTTLNKILENALIDFPDAEYYIDGVELQLLSEPHLPRGKNKKQRNILARSPLLGLDG